MFSQVTGSGSKLSKRHLKKLIDTRADKKQSNQFPFDTFAELELYSESSVAPIYLIAVESQLNQLKNESNLPSTTHLKLDHIATHLGTAQGLSNHIRAIAPNAKRNQCHVPIELMSKHNATHEDILRGRGDKQNVKDVVFEIASRAHQHLNTADDLIVELRNSQTKAFRSLFLSAVSVRRYLRRLQVADFDVFSKSLQVRDGMLPLHMWWSRVRF